jgi:hypothetical protein
VTTTIFVNVITGSAVVGGSGALLNRPLIPSIFSAWATALHPTDAPAVDDIGRAKHL